uniref:Pectinesterase n=1 Tax=Araucaria cunninghamii TaxID=56994 RepID=A0A0D6QUB8_ARACU
MLRRRDNRKMARQRMALAMAALLLLTLAFLAFSLDLSANSAHAQRTRNLLQNSAINLACQASQYPDYCKSSLSKSQLSPNPRPEEIIAAAAALSLDATRESYLESKRLLSLSSNANYTAAVGNCVEFLDGSMRYIQKTRGQELKGLKIKDVEAWLSAALTHQYDCSSALKYVNISQAVGSAMARLVMVTNVTSTALSMVDALDTYGPDTAKWMPPKTERSSAGGKMGKSYAKRIFRELEAKPAVPDVTVSKDQGSPTIQQAVDGAPANSGKRYVIYIKEGIYEEIVRIPPAKRNLMFVGDGMDKTVITGSMSVPSLPAPITTYGSATVAVNADGFMARDITFQNTAGPEQHQAVALRVDGDLSAFHNCAILSHQDSLYTHTLRQFYKNCRIEGTVDFIFGNSAAIFEECLILLRPRQVQPEKGAQNTVTAHARVDPAQSTGFVFHNCTIKGTADYMRYFHDNPKIHKGFLGRPWKMYARTIFMNSYLGEVISPEGWLFWNGNFALDTLYYGEYQNYGPGAKLSGRVPWSNLIPEGNVGMYSVENFIQGEEWQAAIAK